MSPEPKGFRADGFVRSRLAEEALEDGRVVSAYRAALSALLETPDRPYNWRAGNALSQIGSEAPLERPLAAVGSDVRSVAYSPDGTPVLSSSGLNRSLRVWDLDAQSIAPTARFRKDTVFGIG